jgi:hypothetical protein
MFAIGTGDVMLLGHVNKKIQGLILKVIDIKDTVNTLYGLALGALAYIVFRQVIFITHAALEERRER